MGRRPSPSSRNELGEMLGVLRGAFLAVASFSLVINLIMLMPALYMLQIYDRVLASRNEVTLYMLTIIVIGLFLLDALLEMVRAKVLIRAGAALDLRLSPRVLDASFQRHLQGNRGNSSQPLLDMTQVRQFLTGRGLFAFFDAPWTPIFIAVIFLLHPWLGLFAMVAVLVLLVLAYAAERATAQVLDDANREAQAANHEAASHLRNAEVVEAMGMVPSLRKRWLLRQGRTLSLQATASHRGATITAVTKFARMSFQSGVLGVGALLVLADQLSPGGMIASSILLGRALSPVDLAIGTWRNFVAARGGYGRLRDLLSSHPAAADGTALPRPKGQIQVESLILSSPGNHQPILKGIRFEAAAGTLVAVVGPSGSGKSTLARALVGVWAPLSGTVRLDGADVHQWNKTQLGPWIGYLPQDVELLDGTVAENISRFGEPNSELTVAAAQRAGVHEMILRLSRGYETPVGEGGAALSGGERQRIALARAMYGDPALIVLDEPNASLDRDGDEAFIEALREMKRDGRTVFVMTHRPNLLALADSVLVLSGGLIQAFGPRDSVLKLLSNPGKKNGAERPSTSPSAEPEEKAA